MLVPDSYQFMSICHFCHDYCVPPMNLSPTCVLGYAMPSLQGCMPCIFVINVVTSTSMQCGDQHKHLLSHFPDVIFMPCSLVATE